MVGDWLKNTLFDEFEQVDYLEDNNINGHPTDWYEPIPLTPEILERNGFRDVSTHTLKGAETFELWLGDYKLTYKLNDYFALDSLDDRWYRLFETQFCHKWCVHHLQHALKLCGIEKTIEL